jgi:NADH dehydrogenase
MSPLTIGITGAFSYTGKYITRKLLAQGNHVRTLTNNPRRENPFGEQVQVHPFNFDHPEVLIESLRGVDTFINTYWVRFDHGATTFDQAIENTRTLIKAAKAADVQRFVHVSITNPTVDSPLPYFRGKAILEAAVVGSELSSTIIRPTVIFGKEDILINNLAFLLRRFPFFAIPGKGDYRLQPVYVEDLADLAIQAIHSKESLLMDAVGPEIYSFKELVELIARTINSRARLIFTPPKLALTLSRILGLLYRDVILTEDEVEGLMAGLLVSEQPPTGKTSLKEWLEMNRDSVGARYASELKRHYQ